MAFYRDGYVYARNHGSHHTGRVSERNMKDMHYIFMIKSTGSGCGVIDVGNSIVFPKEMLGKRVILKVEIIKDEEEKHNIFGVRQ